MLLFSHSKFKISIDLYHDVEHVFHLTYIGKHFILASCGRFSPSCVHPTFSDFGMGGKDHFCCEITKTSFLDVSELRE